MTANLSALLHRKELTAEQTQIGAQLVAARDIDMRRIGVFVPAGTPGTVTEFGDSYVYIAFRNQSRPLLVLRFEIELPPVGPGEGREEDRCA